MISFIASIPLSLNKGYHRYRYICLIPWPTSLNWQRGAVKNETVRQKKLFQFSLCELPFICSNIPAAPAYGVYLSQLIWYSRAWGSYKDFFDRWLLLTGKLLNQGFLLVKLWSSFRTFYGRHHDLVDRFGISVSQMQLKTKILRSLQLRRGLGTIKMRNPRMFLLKFLITYENSVIM